MSLVEVFLNKFWFEEKKKVEPGLRNQALQYGVQVSLAVPQLLHQTPTACMHFLQKQFSVQTFLQATLLTNSICPFHQLSTIKHFLDDPEMLFTSCLAQTMIYSRTTYSI